MILLDSSTAFHKIRKSETLLRLLVSGSVFSYFILEACAILLFIIRGKDPFYIYHIYPDKEDITAYFLFLITDAYMKAVNVALLFILQFWFVFAALFLITSVWIVR